MNLMGLAYSSSGLSEIDAGIKIYDIDLENMSYSYNTTLTYFTNINTGYDNAFLFSINNSSDFVYMRL